MRSPHLSWVSLVVCVLLLGAGVRCTQASAFTPPAWANGNHHIHFYPRVSEESSPSLQSPTPAAGISPLIAGEPGQDMQWAGGPVQHSPQLYLIFWGSNFADHGALYTELKAFYYGLQAETQEPGQASYQGIIDEYYDNTGNVGKATVAGEWVSWGETAPQNVTEARVLQKIQEGTAFPWSPSPANAQMIVLFAPGTTFASGYDPDCGYHSVTPSGLTYAVVTYGRAGCSRGGTDNHETVGTASHEYAEAATDPNGENGWIDPNVPEEENEVADRCENRPAQELPPINGRPGFWWVAWLWDDMDGNQCAYQDPPPAPPVPITGVYGATEVQENQVQLNGIVNPSGPDTQYYFEYGLTTAYGSNTESADAGTGTTERIESRVVGGLESGTLYHYRIVATNWAGTSRGPDHTIVTVYRPAAQVTTNATEVQSTLEHAEATVHGAVNPEGSPTTYWFKYGTTTALGSGTAFQEAGSSRTKQLVSALLTGLQPNTRYYYEIFSQNSGGTGGGGIKELTTPLPPVAARTEAATNVQATSATLNGSVTAEGLSTTYQYEYWPTEHSSEVHLAPITPASAGSGLHPVAEPQTITGLTEGISYSYRLKTTNSGGSHTGSTMSFIAFAAWSVQATPNPSGATSSQLNGVSCTAAAACIAVGSSEQAATPTPLSERWTGTEWLLLSTPLPTGATKGSLTSVSCTAANACTAAGWSYKEGTYSPLLERWSGSSWTLQTATGVGGTTLLEGVSCASATNCTAVGYYLKVTGPPATYVVSWNGSTWTRQTAPEPTKSELMGISCSSTSACIAAGFDAPTFNVSLAEQWSSGTWTQQTTRNPTGSNRTNLFGVSCSATTACASVGEYEKEHEVYMPLAEWWTGTEWQLQTVPAIAGATGGALRSSSCIATNACTAVGRYQASPTVFVPLAEQWTGSAWQMHVTPTVPSSTSGELLGVSCVSATICVGVGSEKNSSGVTVTLAEAGDPPAVTTTTASAITTTGARLNGTVNPEGQETTYKVEYGLTTTYGQSSTAVSAGNGTSPVEVGETITELSPETTYHYRVVATNTRGTTNGEDHTVVTAPVPPINATQPLLSTANPLQGEPISTSQGTWLHAPISYIYTWFRCNAAGINCQTIAGATTSSYTPVAADVGNTLQATVTASNSAGPSAPAATAVSAVVAVPAPPVNTVLPALSTTAPLTGTPLSTTNGTWTNSPTLYTYSWERCNTAGEACAPIAGANSATYTPGAEDIAHTLRAQVTASNAGGPVSAMSAATTAVLNGAPTNTAPPNISLPTPNQEVAETSTTGTWTGAPTSFAYIWQRCNASGGECANITGATTASYIPVSADVGHTLVVKVTATNSGGATTMPSAATNTVKALGELHEYAVPGGAPTYAIALGTDGNVWFGKAAPSRYARITTVCTITEYPGLTEGEVQAITTGPEGELWFSRGSSAGIGAFTTEGALTAFYPVTTAVCIPGITAASEVSLWFTEMCVAKVAKITMGGHVTEYSVPTPSEPFAITTGPDGNLWFTDYGSSKISRITTGGTITEYSLATGSHPRGIVAGPDGKLWFAESGTSKIGSITTSGTVTEYAVGTGSAPYGIAAGPDGKLWFTANGTNKIGRITTTGTVTEYALPVGSAPKGITAGADGTLWYTATGTAKVGHIVP